MPRGVHSTLRYAHVYDKFSYQLSHKQYLTSLQRHKKAWPTASHIAIMVAVCMVHSRSLPVCPGTLGATARKKIRIHGDRGLPVLRGRHVMGLAVRVLLKKLERITLQFFLHLPDMPISTLVCRCYWSARTASSTRWAAHITACCPRRANWCRLVDLTTIGAASFESRPGCAPSLPCCMLTMLSMLCVFLVHRLSSTCPMCV